MPPRFTRRPPFGSLNFTSCWGWPRAAVIGASIFGLSACGFEEIDSGADGTAVSASPALAQSPEQSTAQSAQPSAPQPTGQPLALAPAQAKATINKVDPVVRPGVEVPLDSVPNLSKMGPRGRLFSSGFEAGVRLTEPAGFRLGDRLIVGGDTGGAYRFSEDLWQTPEIRRHLVRSVVSQASGAAATEYLTASIRTVVGRSGGPSRALSLHSKALSGGGSDQELAVQFAEMGIEPVLYQRMWVKFDPRTLADAQATGQRHFHQIFWEATALPDYRLRLKLRYADGGGLYWQAKADAMDDTRSLWEVNLTTVPVVLARADQPAGWHRVELWLDRPNQRFKVSIDGTPLIDRTGPLAGTSGSRLDALKTMVVRSASNPLAETLFDDVEYWSTPPEDAFRLPASRPN